MNVNTLLKNQLRKNVPNLRAGQVIRVHERIKEGDKERVQVFEGLVIAVKHGKGLNSMFTVRKIGAGGMGVERIFPLHMPAIEKIEILRQERVRRAKLYYVRDQVGKKTKKRKTKLQNLIYDMGGTEEPPALSGEDEGQAENSEQLEEEGTKDKTVGKENSEAKTEEAKDNKKEEAETKKESKEEDKKK